MAAVIRITVEKINYRNRYLSVEETVENISGIVLEIPKLVIKLRIAVSPFPL